MKNCNIVFKVINEDQVELYNNQVDYKLEIVEELLDVLSMKEFKSLLLRQFNTIHKDSLKDVTALKVIIPNIENSLMVYDLTTYENKHRDIFLSWYNEVIKNIGLVYKGLNNFIGIDSSNLVLTEQESCDNLCGYRIGVERDKEFEEYINIAAEGARKADLENPTLPFKRYPVW